MNNKKLFVGGYYDDRMFEGEEFEGKTPFNKDINTYTLEEALKLGFCDEENIIENYGNVNIDKNWEDTTYKEKVEAIMDYTEDDDIAGLLYFDTEEQAEKYKNEVLEEIKELENDIEYIGKEQNRQGIYQEVYKSKEA